MPSLHFRDAFGTVVIPSTAPTFGNWVPDVEEIGDRQTGLGTGTEYVFGFRTDYTVSLEMTNIPAASLNDLARLKRHLVGGQTGTGGLVTVFTDDAASRVYTCSLKPGTTPEWTLSDRTNLEYTLRLALRHVAPVFMVCDYTALKGPDQNLIVNGGGETGTVGQAAPSWGSDDPNTMTLTVESEQSFFGLRSLSHTNTATLLIQHSAQAPELVAGQRYLYSGWVLLNAGTAGDFAALSTFSPAGIDVPIWSYNGLPGSNNDSAGVVAAAAGMTGWRFAAKIFVANADSPFGSTGSYLFTESAGAAQSWFDGVRLVPVPAS